MIDQDTVTVESRGQTSVLVAWAVGHDPIEKKETGAMFWEF